MAKRTASRSKEPLKVACIGAGSSGVGHMLLLERYMPGCCVAFCDRSRELFDEIVGGCLAGQVSAAAGDFKTDPLALRPEFRDLPFYTDPEEMLAKEPVNTVVIATWCASHAEMVERCVKHNVNILLEKPIAITEKDVEKVWRLLRHYPKVATVNFTMRGAPVSLAARRHVQNGDLGKIVSVQYVNNVHYGDVYFRKWMRTRANIGSLLLQKATHDLDIINSIIGLKPVSVAAFGSRLVYGGDKPNELTCDTCQAKWSCPKSIYSRNLHAACPLPPVHLRKCPYAQEIDIDDNHTVIIQYEGGVTCSYSETFNAPMQGGRRGGSFIGTEGIMDLEYYGDFVENPRGEIIFGNSTITITHNRAKPGSRICETYDWAGHGHFDGTEYGMLAKLDLLDGRPTLVPNSIYEGYISAKMCLAAQESITKGKIVHLNLNL